MAAPARGPSGSAATCTTGSSATCYLGIERRTSPDGSSEELEAYWSEDGVHWQGIWGSTVTLHSGDALYAGGTAGIAAISDSSGHSSTVNMSAVSLTASLLLDEYPTGSVAPFGHGSREHLEQPGR